MVTWRFRYIALHSSLYSEFKCTLGCRFEYRASHSESEYRLEFRPGGSHIGLCIRTLSVKLNVD